MFFWFAFAVLLALALVAIVRPLLAREHEAAGGTATDVFAEQLSELDRDRDRGLISKADAAAARTEIARRLLREKDNVVVMSGEARRARAFAFAIAAFIPAFTMGAYAWFGAPSMPDQPLAARLAPIDGTQLVQMVQRAEDRLSAQPDDGEGWAAIAPAYQQLRRFSDAAAAYGRANTLLGPSADRLTGQGENLALANGGIVSPPAHALFAEALALEPSAITPAIFLAIGARQGGRFAEAAERWKALLARSDGTEPWLQVARAEIQRIPPNAGDLEGFSPSSERPLGGAAPAPARPGPTLEAARATALPTGQQDVMIEAMVSGLAARLAREGGTVSEWARLVRSYRVLGRDDDAIKALDGARAALSPDEFAQVEQSARP